MRTIHVMNDGQFTKAVDTLRTLCVNSNISSAQLKSLSGAEVRMLMEKAGHTLFTEANARYIAGALLGTRAKARVSKLKLAILEPPRAVLGAGTSPAGTSDGRAHSDLEDRVSLLEGRLDALQKGLGAWTERLDRSLADAVASLSSLRVDPDRIDAIEKKLKELSAEQAELGRAVRVMASIASTRQHPLKQSSSGAQIDDEVPAETHARL